MIWYGTALCSHPWLLQRSVRLLAGVRPARSSIGRLAAAPVSTPRCRDPRLPLHDRRHHGAIMDGAPSESHANRFVRGKCGPPAAAARHVKMSGRRGSDDGAGRARSIFNFHGARRRASIYSFVVIRRRNAIIACSGDVWHHVCHCSRMDVQPLQSETK